MDLSDIKRLAFKEMGGRSSHAWKEKGNKYHHGERVARLALTLRELLFPSDPSRDSVITVAAWFHDIENGCDNHCERGAVKTRALLSGLCAPDELDEICAIIAVHDIRHGDRSDLPVSAKLHQDADHLDHFGTYDVWMNFLYAVPHGLTLPEQLKYMQNERPGEDERYRAELNFALSRSIYDEKAEFLRDFTERFAVEADGRFYNLNKILENCKSEGTLI